MAQRTVTKENEINTIPEEWGQRATPDFWFSPILKVHLFESEIFQQLKHISSTPAKVQGSLSLVLQSPSGAGVTPDCSAGQGHLCAASGFPGTRSHGSRWQCLCSPR